MVGPFETYRSVYMLLLTVSSSGFFTTRIEELNFWWEIFYQTEYYFK